MSINLNRSEIYWFRNWQVWMSPLSARKLTPRFFKPNYFFLIFICYFVSLESYFLFQLLEIVHINNTRSSTFFVHFFSCRKLDPVWPRLHNRILFDDANQFFIPISRSNLRNFSSSAKFPIFYSYHIMSFSKSFFNHFLEKL